MKLFVCVFLVFAIVSASPYPERKGAMFMAETPIMFADNQKGSPMMMIRGFYTRPGMKSKLSNTPEGAMTAIVAGEMASAGTAFMSDNCGNDENIIPIIDDVEPEQSPSEVDRVTQLVETETTTFASPKSRPQDSDEDDEDDQSNIFGGSKTFNSFFPISFGGKARTGGATMPGVLAIANSYSSGKGGLATSHATAYGSGKH